jgi:hypothetical protein
MRTGVARTVVWEVVRTTLVRVMRVKRVIMMEIMRTKRIESAWRQGN